MRSVEQKKNFSFWPYVKVRSPSQKCHVVVISMRTKFMFNDDQVQQSS